MKRLLVLCTVLLVLLPTLALARPVPFVPLVYKGALKQVGHEFETASMTGTAWKGKDNVYLVLSYDSILNTIVEGYLVSTWQEETGIVGDYAQVLNLNLVTDTTSARQSATLFSFDAWGDVAEPFAFVLQGAVGEFFTGIETVTIPKTLMGNNVGMSSWIDGVTYAEVSAGAMKLKLDKNYTLANQGDVLLTSVVSQIIADLELKGVTFLSAPPVGGGGI